MPELDTMLCQPEMAPHAMVTNMIGQRGPIVDVEARIGGKGEIGMENKNTNNAEEKSQEDDVRCHVVDRECESPDRQNGSKVTEDERSYGPQGSAVGKGAPRIVSEGATVPSHMPIRAITTADHRGQNDILSPPVDHLTGQEPADGQEEPCHGELPSEPMAVLTTTIAKGPCNEEEIEIDEGKAG